MKLLRAIAFILGADCLFCWFLTSKYWIFDPVTGVFLLMAGVLWIGTIGFSRIEEDSNSKSK
ncbi:MAG TPA: hypothetical protein V6C57_08635 [Coleofasciculaceae cyanobacterium]